MTFAEESKPQKHKVEPTFGPQLNLDSLEADNPVQLWCNSINKDSTNNDAKVYMRSVLERSQSRASHEAEELLGESPHHPLSNLPAHSPPREQVVDLEKEKGPIVEAEHCDFKEEPFFEDDCRVGGGSEEPHCCISQGMFLLPVF